MGDEIDKALSSFVDKGLKAEIAAGEAIHDALVKEVQADKKLAAEGDTVAQERIAKAILGGGKTIAYRLAVLDAAGMDFPSASQLLSEDPEILRMFDNNPDLVRQASVIYEWAERLVVWGECSEPPRREMFNFEVSLWGSRGGRKPDESWPAPASPMVPKGQRYVVKWLTWLGFDVDAYVSDPEVGPLPLSISTTPERLTSEAKRLQIVLAAHGYTPRIQAEYTPHLGAQADDAYIQVSVEDDDIL
jgi:hypothetical protein